MFVPHWLCFDAVMQLLVINLTASSLNPAVDQNSAVNIMMYIFVEEFMDSHVPYSEGVVCMVHMN